MAEMRWSVSARDTIRSQLTMERIFLYRWERDYGNRWRGKHGCVELLVMYLDSKKASRSTTVRLIRHE